MGSLVEQYIFYLLLPVYLAKEVPLSTEDGTCLGKEAKNKVVLPYERLKKCPCSVSM